MRPPRKLVGRYAFEHAARGASLVVEFLEHGGTHGHDGTLLFVEPQILPYDFGFTANGPTAGFGCVLASAPSSSFTPRAIAAVSLPAWKQVKSGRSRHANGPHSLTFALMAASCTMLIARS